MTASFSREYIVHYRRPGSTELQARRVSATSVERAIAEAERLGGYFAIEAVEVHWRERGKWTRQEVK